MSYEIEISYKGEYVLVQLAGQDSYQASVEIYQKIAAACVKYECLKVLAISHLTPLDTMDAFKHFEIIQAAGITRRHRIAWVETNPETVAVDQFIENVLVNRGFYQMRLFSAASEAKEWLLADPNA